MLRWRAVLVCAGLIWRTHIFYSHPSTRCGGAQLLLREQVRERRVVCRASCPAAVGIGLVQDHETGCGITRTQGNMALAPQA